MEKTTQEISKTNECIILDARKTLKTTGITEVTNSSDNEIIAKLKDTLLIITGTQLHITRLDVSSGILEAEGLINSIQYGKKNNFFKRIFK